MKKSANTVSKENSIIDVLSTEIISNLQLEDIVEEDSRLEKTVVDTYESDCTTDCDGTNVEQHENITHPEESSSNYHEKSTKTIENKSDIDMNESCAHFKSVTGKMQKANDKNVTRKKMKDYNIISIRNAVARQPSYFKFDKSTTTLLDLLIQHRLVAEYHNIIGKGVKSVVIHANCYGKYHTYFPCGNAVKVYKLSKDDDKNKVICKLVQREVDLLYTLSTKYLGNNFPHPVYRTKNIVVMSFIGTDQETAPSVTTVPSEHSQEVYHSIVKDMSAWYNKLHLVHGNLSTKSVLYWLGKLHYIGWSHFVLKDHPKALMKLMKDCEFVTKFFESRDIPVKPTEELFKDITGLDDISNKVLEVIHTKNLWEDQRQTNPNRKNDIASKPSRNSRFK